MRSRLVRPCAAVLAAHAATPFAAPASSPAEQQVEVTARCPARATRRRSRSCWARATPSSATTRSRPTRRWRSGSMRVSIRRTSRGCVCSSSTAGSARRCRSTSTSASRCRPTGRAPTPTAACCCRPTCPTAPSRGRSTCARPACPTTAAASATCGSSARPTPSTATCSAACARRCRPSGRQRRAVPARRRRGLVRRAADLRRDAGRRRAPPHAAVQLPARQHRHDGARRAVRLAVCAARPRLLPAAGGHARGPTTRRWCSTRWTIRSRSRRHDATRAIAADRGLRLCARRLQHGRQRPARAARRRAGAGAARARPHDARRRAAGARRRRGDPLPERAARPGTTTTAKASPRAGTTCRTST